MTAKNFKAEYKSTKINKWFNNERMEALRKRIEACMNMIYNRITETYVKYKHHKGVVNKTIRKEKD